MPPTTSAVVHSGWCAGSTCHCYAPACSPPLLLVLVDVMKEMPATLLLRPYGWDTLAVRIYEMTSEGEWERAALRGGNPGVGRRCCR